jgi:tryptophanyl-tRNA synthetase
MRSKLGIIVGLAMLSASATIALADDTSATSDKVKAAVTPGEFVLTGSDVKTIHDGSSARQYRVCLKREQGATDMKVRYDDNEANVKLGDCKTVTGRKIEATPSSALHHDERIVGTFHHVRSEANADESTKR